MSPVATAPPSAPSAPQRTSLSGSGELPVTARPVPGLPPGRRRQAGPLGRPPLLEPGHVRPAQHRAARMHDPAPITEDALPDPTGLCVAIVRSAMEVLEGGRPLAQLIRWVDPEIYEALGRRAVLLKHAAGPGTRRGRPLAIRRARTVRLGANAAETAVVVDDRHRVRAVAVRVEARRGMWRVTALEIG